MRLFTAVMSVMFASAAAVLSAVAQPATLQRATSASTFVTVRVANRLLMSRSDEVIALSWAALLKQLPALTSTTVRAVDPVSGAEFLVQPYSARDAQTTDSLLVLVDFRPGEVREFRIEAKASNAGKPRVFARHDEERDDVAWESDRIAFRTYGVGLVKVEPLSSSGMDIWNKKTREMIVESWYAKGHDDYHVDKGEGADFFDVGTSLGAGGTAVWANNRLYKSRNFSAWRIVANGPIRVAFELRYEPWNAGGMNVSEVKRITLDAGANFNRNESVFTFTGADSIAYATGVVKRGGIVGSTSIANGWAWLTGWGLVSPKSGGHGELGTAVLLPRERLLDWKETTDHYLAIATARSGVPVVHYFGAGWTDSGDYTDVRAWWRSLDQLAMRAQSPIRVTMLSWVAPREAK